jgi:low affinity Fe/Cu permease
MPTKKSKANTLNESFNSFAHGTAIVMGNPWSFIVSILLILVWGLTGPLFHYSNTWQLVINTGTTIITFLAVFLIQNTQNRDARALHLKVDELLRSGDKARNRLIDLQNMSDEELDELERQFKICRKRHTAVTEPPLNDSRTAANARDKN